MAHLNACAPIASEETKLVQPILCIPALWLLSSEYRLSWQGFEKLREGAGNEGCEIYLYVVVRTYFVLLPTSVLPDPFRDWGVIGAIWSSRSAVVLQTNSYRLLAHFYRCDYYMLQAREYRVLGQPLKKMYFGNCLTTYRYETSRKMPQGTRSSQMYIQYNPCKAGVVLMWRCKTNHTTIAMTSFAGMQGNRCILS